MKNMKFLLLFFCIYLQTDAHCPSTSYKLPTCDIHEHEVSKDFFEEYQAALVDTKLTVSVFDSQSSNAQKTLEVFKKISTMKVGAYHDIFQSYMKENETNYLVPFIGIKYMTDEEDIVQTSTHLFAQILGHFLSIHTNCILNNEAFANHEKITIIALPTDSIMKGLEQRFRLMRRIHETIIRAVLRWKYYFNLEGRTIIHKIEFMMESNGRKGFFETEIERLHPIVREEVAKIHPTNVYPPTDSQDSMLGHILFKSTVIPEKKFNTSDADALVLASSLTDHRCLVTNQFDDVGLRAKHLFMCTDRAEGTAQIFPKFMNPFPGSNVRYLISAFAPDFQTKYGVFNTEERLKNLRLSIERTIVRTSEGYITHVGILCHPLWNTEDLSADQMDRIYNIIVESAATYISEFYNSYGYLRVIEFIVPNEDLKRKFDGLILQMSKAMKPHIDQIKLRKEAIQREPCHCWKMAATYRDRLEIRFPSFADYVSKMEQFFGFQ